MKIFTVWAVAAMWFATSCTSYKTVPYMINSAEVDLDSSAVLYEARVMPKDELTITVNCPEDAEAGIPFNLTATPAVGQGRGTLTSQPTLQTFLVTNEGTINYPVLGTLKVGGMTVNQVEDLIASKIEGTYLKTRPVVTVRLSNYKISVLGEVTSPGTSPFSTINSSTVSCQICRLGVFSNISRHAQINLPRSHCARGLHMAGPFERLSMRNWIAVRSVTIPMYPPSASISLTICPFAMPPTAGLQLICPILFISIVIRQVFEPRFAAAAAASQPACPAPITITSYLKSIDLFLFTVAKLLKSCQKVG